MLLPLASRDLDFEYYKHTDSIVCRKGSRLGEITAHLIPNAMLLLDLPHNRFQSRLRFLKQRYWWIEPAGIGAPGGRQPVTLISSAEEASCRLPTEEFAVGTRSLGPASLLTR